MNIGFLSHFDLNLYLFRRPIMQELKRRGWRVYAIAPEGEYLQKFQEEGIETISYDIDRKSLNPFKEFRTIQNIYRAVVPLRLDILHTFTAKPNIYGTFAAAKAKVPHIFNLVEGLGSFYVHNDIRSQAIRFVMEQLYKKAFTFSEKVVFVNSDDPKYMIDKEIIDPKKVTIIKSVGIDLQKFDPANFKKIDFGNKPVVLMIARAIWDKGVREFYETARRLSHKATFVYVGDVDEGNPTSATKEFMQNGDVNYLGQREDIVDLLGSCDIFVLPSYREGLPRTLLEAAAMAKPMVATDTVGCKDVVKDGVNGYLVPVGDVAALSQRVEKLIENPDLRREMGEKARQMVQEFDMDNVVKQYVRLYEEAVGV